MAVTALDPMLEGSITRYDAARAAAQAVLAGLDDEVAHRAPPGGGWTVAQCLDHLLVIGSRMGVRLEESIARAIAEQRFAKPGRHAQMGWFDALFLRATGPARKEGGRPPMPVTAPAVFAPGAGASVAVLGEQFAALQDRLTAAAHSAEGLDLEGIKVPSLMSDRIKLQLGAWFVGIAGHQERHLAQARRTRAALGL